MNDKHDREIVELIIPMYKDKITTLDLEMASGDLIRGKDCKYCTVAADKKWRQDFGKSIYECDHMNLNIVEPNWFCADGMPKDSQRMD